MDQFLSDVRFAFRSMRRRPAVFALAAASLAIGIAANTTIFAAIDAYLLRPFPFPDPDRIALVYTTNPERGWTRASSSIPDFVDWQRESRSFTALGAHAGGSFNLLAGDRPERVVGVRATPGVFQSIGLAPLIGRSFAPEEAEPGRGNVVLLSYAYWHRRFAADPRIVGSTLSLDGTTYTVVGVMPKDFTYPTVQAEIWTPLTIDPAAKRDDRFVQVVGRLRPGVTAEAAAREVKGIAERLAQAYPTNKGLSANAMELHAGTYGPEFRRGATVSMVSVVFVLLIACANVANLLLARGADRGREVALRSAIGAGRGRLVRQLLTESALLGIGAGAFGAVLSVWGIRAFTSIVPANFPRTDTIALDARALLFTLAISVGSGLLFGILPALRLATGSTASTLREGGRAGTMGARHNRLGAALVVGEIALALSLLIAAGLLIKGSVQMQRVDLGFDATNLMSLRVAVPKVPYGDTAAVVRFHERLTERLGAIPGAQAHVGASDLPMRSTPQVTYLVDGEPRPEASRMPYTSWRSVMPGYLAAMKIGLLQGRDFQPADRIGAPLVVMVNEAFVDRHWKGQSALGRRVDLDDGAGPREIVGIVRASRDYGPDDEPPPLVYVPMLQRMQRTATYVVRSAAAPAVVATAMRAAVAEVDPSLPAYDVRSMAEIIEMNMAGPNLMPRLLMVFGGIALVLAVMGVYGVMSYAVTQRTQEVGIRVALGAQRGNILTLIVRQGAMIAGIGMVLGLGLAALTTRTLSAFLEGVSAFDVGVFGGVTLALGIAALVASTVPALRALRVDPLVALRSD